MAKRIQLNQAYIARVRKENKHLEDEVAGLALNKAKCKFCGHRTIDQFEDLSGHYSARCEKCGQVGIYKANCRRYSYITAFLPLAEPISISV